jgi:hypothetical protein
MRNATRNIQQCNHATCKMQHATCNAEHATCGSDTRHATCGMRHATCNTRRCPFQKIHTVILKATTRPFRRGGRRRAKVPLRPPRPVASSGAMDESLAAPPRPVKATDDADKGIDIALKGTDDADKGTDIALKGTDNADKDIDIGVKGTDNADKGIDIAVECRCTYNADAAPSVVPSWPNVNEVSKSSVCTSPCAPTLDRSPKHAAAQLQP